MRQSTHGSLRAADFSLFWSGRILAPTAAPDLLFFSVFHQVKCPCGEVDFWLRELQLWLALIPMQFWYPRQPADGHFFLFLIGSNFGSKDSCGPVLFFSFSPGEMPMWRGGLLAPRAAVVVGFDSDVFLVPMAARGQWFFPIFDRAEFWLRRQARSLRFFQFFTR